MFYIRATATRSIDDRAYPEIVLYEFIDTKENTTPTDLHTKSVGATYLSATE